MEPIVYIDRITKEREVERVYGQSALKFLYGDDWVSSLLGFPLIHFLVRNSLFSSLYGYWQKHSISKQKVRPFVEVFQLDPSEFLQDIDSYNSFNEFFIRQLKVGARPIDADINTAIIPADGRYMFYQDVSRVDGFLVKGEKFNLATLLEDEKLAEKYAKGSMVIARLCPTDYHRFHFPCDCTPNEAKLINGWLYSVNPIALKRDIHIFTKNKRALTELTTDLFGKVLFLEIGATNVGSIHQTYIPIKHYPKGAEKGYFSFGASSLILLFEQGKIILDEDLLQATSQQCEIKCLMGQSMGQSSLPRSDLDLNR